MILRIFIFLLLLGLSSVGSTTEIAILDTGLNLKIKELKRFIPVDKKDGLQAYDFVKNNRKLEDTQGHGTHIFSIISMGESPKNLKIYPLRFSDGQDSPELLFTHQYRYIKALEMAVGLDVDIINISYTHGMPNEKEESLIKKALEKNILIIVAAGNKSIDFDKKKDSLTYPCNYEIANVICVGNYDNSAKAKDNSSNFGSAVKIWTDGNLKVGFSNNLSEGLTIGSGSSYSAALITRELSKLKTRQERKSKVEEWIKNKEPVLVKYP